MKTNVCFPSCYKMPFYCVGEVAVKTNYVNLLNLFHFKIIQVVIESKCDFFAVGHCKRIPLFAQVRTGEEIKVR